MGEASSTIGVRLCLVPSACPHRGAPAACSTGRRELPSKSDHPHSRRRSSQRLKGSSLALPAERCRASPMSGFDELAKAVVVTPPGIIFIGENRRGVLIDHTEQDCDAQILSELRTRNKHRNHVSQGRLAATLLRRGNV